MKEPPDIQRTFDQILCTAKIIRKIQFLVLIVKLLDFVYTNFVAHKKCQNREENDGKKLEQHLRHRKKYICWK